jgi:putative transposase
MESFFALLLNVLDRQRWRSRDGSHEAIVFWIEQTYNRRRRQRAFASSRPSSTSLPALRHEAWLGMIDT